MCQSIIWFSSQLILVWSFPSQGEKKKKSPQLLKRGPWFKRSPHDGSREWIASPPLVLKLCHRKDSWLPGDAPLCSDQPHQGRVGQRPQPWAFVFICSKTRRLLSFVSGEDQDRRGARTDLREDPSKPCHKHTVFSPMYLSLRETFFVKIEDMGKVQVCCCFEEFEQRGVFPGTQFQNQHMDTAWTRKNGVSSVTIRPQLGSQGPHHPRLSTVPLGCHPRWQDRKEERSRCLCSWLSYCCWAGKIVFPRAYC